MPQCLTCCLCSLRLASAWLANGLCSKVMMGRPLLQLCTARPSQALSADSRDHATVA